MSSTLIHGFLWLQCAPGMEILDWEDPVKISYAKAFFDKYVTSWNPRNYHDTNVHMHLSIEDYSCLRNTIEILASNLFYDYKEILNRVQCHTKCDENTCLHRKGSKLQCRYNYPWNLHIESSLFIEDISQKKYDPPYTDDHLNIHNPNIRKIW
jgi:hypothetical protein